MSSSFAYVPNSQASEKRHQILFFYSQVTQLEAKWKGQNEHCFNVLQSADHPLSELIESRPWDSWRAWVVGINKQSRSEKIANRSGTRCAEPLLLWACLEASLLWGEGRDFSIKVRKTRSTSCAVCWDGTLLLFFFSLLTLGLSVTQGRTILGTKALW